MSRLVLVACSPRTPPGVLTWPAWQVLHQGPALVGDASHVQLAHLEAAGVTVEVSARDAGTLLDRARAAGQVVWLSSGAADTELVRTLGDPAVRSGVDLEVVYGSYDAPGARLLDVVAVMDRLRSPGGCPWDAAQTHSSLAPYLVEESYELLQTLEDGDGDGMREELGDVLLQVAFHARLAQEHPSAPFTVDDVAADLVDKLVRRHPHVFAGGPADDLEGTWDALKAAEKGRTSVTDGVPLGQPALSLASKLQKRAGKLGVPPRSYDGLPGELWALVTRCRQAGVDPEAALRAVARTYRDALAAVERDARAAGREPADLTPQEWAERWT